MVFDDIACEKQDSVRAYFSMARHKNVNCFYLCQSYAKVPKHSIRDNFNLLAIFCQDDVNLKHIYDDNFIRMCLIIDSKNYLQSVGVRTIMVSLKSINIEL